MSRDKIIFLLKQWFARGESENSECAEQSNVKQDLDPETNLQRSMAFAYGKSRFTKNRSVQAISTKKFLPEGAINRIGDVPH